MSFQPSRLAALLNRALEFQGGFAFRRSMVLHVRYVFDETGALTVSQLYAALTGPC